VRLPYYKGKDFPFLNNCYSKIFIRSITHSNDAWISNSRNFSQRNKTLPSYLVEMDLVYKIFTAVVINYTDNLHIIGLTKR
jgi:hypothetical protein